MAVLGRQSRGCQRLVEIPRGVRPEERLRENRGQGDPRGRQRRLALPGADREEGRQVGLRRRRRTRGDHQSARRAQRARHDAGAPGGRRCATRIRGQGCGRQRLRRLCEALPLVTWEKGRPLLAHGRQRAAEPVGTARRRRLARGLRQACESRSGGVRQAVSVPRLLLPHHDLAGEGRRGGCLRLHRGEQAPRRLRRGRLARVVQELRRHDLHRQPRWRRLREGSRGADGLDSGRHDALQPRHDVEESAMRTLLLAAGLALVLPGTAIAQQAPAGAAPAQTVDSVRQAVRADKRAVVEKNMQLTPEEAKKFWPQYDAYQKELDKIHTRQTRAMLDYISSEASMTDANAKRIAREVMAADADEQKLRERTARKMLGVLPAKKAVRFLQIENKIRLIQRYDIAEQMRLVN